MDYLIQAFLRTLRWRGIRAEVVNMPRSVTHVIMHEMPDQVDLILLEVMSLVPSDNFDEEPRMEHACEPYTSEEFDKAIIVKLHPRDMSNKIMAIDAALANYYHKKTE